MAVGGVGSELMKATNSEIACDDREFGGLSLMERRYLEHWERAARVVGIDAVEDLAQRPWPCSVDGAVIGIFGEADEVATWLVVKHNGRWAIACCADNTVSHPVDSLADALAQLCAPDDSSLGEPP
jgi:hypothetical protein